MSERNRARLADLVTADPAVMHGTVCFRGTRVPVELLLNDLKSGHTIEEFLDGCPTVSREQVQAYLELTQDLILECVES